MSEPVIQILQDKQGWSFHCRYCRLFSGKRATESRAKKEAARHEKLKIHLSLAKKAEEINAP